MENLKIPTEIEIPKDEHALIITGRKYQSLIVPFIITILIIFSPILTIFSIFIIISLFTQSLYGLLSLDSPLIQIFIIYSATFSVLLIVVPILAYFYCKSHRYIITDKRLIIFKKFIFITIRETLLRNFTDILLRQGPIARWKNYGGISPITPGMEFKQYYSGGIQAQAQTQIIRFIGLEGIPNPFYMISQLTNIQQYGKLREDAR